MPAVLYEKKGHIAYITINRPERMNALGSEVTAGLREAIFDVRTDSEVRVAIVTGAGDRAFCAGADLKQAADRLAPANRSRRPTLRATWKCLWRPTSPSSLP